MDGAAWLGWLFAERSVVHPAAGNTGEQARTGGASDSICKVPFLLYTEAAGIHAGAFL